MHTKPLKWSEACIITKYTTNCKTLYMCMEFTSKYYSVYGVINLCVCVCV